MRPPEIELLYFDGRHYDQRYKNYTQDIPFWINQVKKHADPVVSAAPHTKPLL